ncbi:MAG: rod shape-determining protein MreC [Actinomycetota bacterium]|nr:rod shape-determining protein MreC [Actinomycetota bacterium]MED6328249.1 rod shape-determining protein MreC [Actinomycetota bacterium]MEE2958369.1 rod shape-determining protein MreC [Actinomycetota bacterium]
MAAPGGGRSRPTLLILVAAALTLLTMQYRGVEPLAAFQRGVRDVVEPLRSATDRISAPFRSAWNGLLDYDELVAENERLADELARQRGRRLTAEADAELLDRLLGEVGIDVAGGRSVVVRILGTPPGNFATHTIEVDKGSDDGLAEGMPVVTAAGLVGRLETVDRSRSTVRLATHPEFRVGVRLVGSQDEGLARGGGQTGFLVVDAGIGLDAKVEAGEVVVTSGGRSLFPADVPVGRVLDPDEDADYERTVVVEPIASLENLSFLNVLLIVDEPTSADPSGLRGG